MFGMRVKSKVQKLSGVRRLQMMGGGEGERRRGVGGGGGGAERTVAYASYSPNIC